ncbi:hypothetical protein [Cognatiyoonia sp. IB215182]|uniref:hypothetical protein n=1 Tax=Cognatiyoonia sp. IB215182 TaxID=3097353 RepID=UPI002A173760|nr:hypothetical protein [Cognatiyoonia sp. IB215182]MDX8354393.1 hypothetical protein [Cognatiyoonia sp. IB215182]
MFQPDENGVYASVHASPARRIFAYAVLFALGILVLYTALAHPPSIGWLVFLLAFGIGALWLAERLRRATLLRIDLTATDIRDSAGTVLATMDEIRAVDRGVFAFKPSNGFTLVMDTKMPRGWAPGLWWRLGRRVGVGGVTSAGQAKFMAEQIAFRLNQRSN